MCVLVFGTCLPMSFFTLFLKINKCDLLKRPLHLPSIANKIYSQCVYKAMRLKTLVISSSHSQRECYAYEHTANLTHVKLKMVDANLVSCEHSSTLGLTWLVPKCRIFLPSVAYTLVRLSEDVLLDILHVNQMTFFTSRMMIGWHFFK